MILRRSPAGGCFVNGKYFKGGQFLPAHGDVVSYDECRIKHEIAESTIGDHVYARAMAATLRGSTAQRHRAVLRSRRLRAISRLVERAEFDGDRRGRARLHEIHQRTLQGALTLAGS
ncbi:hypothetical protein LCGC14_2267810 [marine sediment metagenome]|uniref:Uncharacterized protein n=1 Tax=marine sediment metagenome TaxID=412755 RepID=A0A0F9FSU4_9ZZZZ